MTDIAEPLPPDAPTVRPADPDRERPATAAPDRPRRGVLLAAIVAATFMVAVEATIVATAMPHIVGQLGGFRLYSWVFSAYLLAQCTMTLIFGKLSDSLGRRPVLLAGIAIFLFGSLLAGFAGSMAALIGFRLLQGIGAGAVQPTTITLVGDLYTPAERPRIQGVLAGVWASAAVAGPLAGGIIVDHLRWGWVFWINLPVGALCAAGFALFLRGERAHRDPRIDWFGAALFAVSVSCLLLFLTPAGFGAGTRLALAAACVAGTVLLVLQERRAPEPLIAIALWRSRLMAASNTASLLAGMALIGVTTILPLYVQGVMGRRPVVAGLTLTALLVGWPMAVMSSGYCFKRFGLRRTLRAGSPALAAGSAILLLLTPRSGVWLASAGSLLMGVGMGLVSTGSIILVQEGVEARMRGSATASIIFSRSLGNALGATVLGAILSLGITRFGGAGHGGALHRLLDRPTGLAALAGDPILRPVFDGALHWSFGAVLAMAVLTVAASWLLPPRAEAIHRSL